MYLSLADAQGTWVVFYEDKTINPRKVVCWALNEYTSGSRKIVPIVHGGGGKLVDANSIGKIGALLSGKSAQDKFAAEWQPEGDSAQIVSPSNGESEDKPPIVSSWAPPARNVQPTVPELEDE